MVHPGDEETRFTGRIPTQERLIKLLCTGKPINALFVCLFSLTGDFSLLSFHLCIMTRFIDWMVSEICLPLLVSIGPMRDVPQDNCIWMLLPFRALRSSLPSELRCREILQIMFASACYYLKKTQQLCFLIEHFHPYTFTYIIELLRYCLYVSFFL